MWFRNFLFYFTFFDIYYSCDLNLLIPLQWITFLSLYSVLYRSGVGVYRMDFLPFNPSLTFLVATRVYWSYLILP